MHIKRFEADSMIEAVRKVKEELGPDALVLSTRHIKKGEGWFGLFARDAVEVTAAVDRDAKRQPTAPDSPPRAEPDPSWRELRTTKALVNSLEAEIRMLRDSVESLRRPGSDTEEALRELSQLRSWTAELAGRARGNGEDPAEARFATRLLAAGVSPRHAYRLGREAASRESSERDSERRVLSEVLAHEFDTRLLPPRSDDVDVELFVGPTGVGKTTTLAKLAAREERLDGGVRLLTTDTFRIGAEAQLRTYAGLLGVPFGVACSPQDLEQQLGQRTARRTLVDTAGRGRDEAALGELARYREALGRRGRVHLVLSATTKDAELRSELGRYQLLRPDSLIMTKLDEAETVGNLANLLLDPDVPPLAWATNGQRVPEDLVLPEPGPLAEEILGGSA